jgi:hypothetical protein
MRRSDRGYGRQPPATIHERGTTPARMGCPPRRNTGDASSKALFVIGSTPDADQNGHCVAAAAGHAAIVSHHGTHGDPRQSGAHLNVRSSGSTGFATAPRERAFSGVAVPGGDPLTWRWPPAAIVEIGGSN